MEKIILRDGVSGLGVLHAHLVAAPRLLRSRRTSEPSDLSMRDGIRLTAHIAITTTELTVTVVNLGCDPVTVRETGLVLGRRRAPREVLVGYHADEECRTPTINAGGAHVCARIPLRTVAALVSRFHLRPSRMKGRITLMDGRVLVSKALRTATA